MRKIIVSVFVALLAASAYSKDIQELVVTTTPPMSCQNCENKIKSNLRFEKGVKKIETNLADQRVTIEYDADKTTPAKIEEGFHKIGYNVEVIESPQTCNPKENEAASEPEAKAGSEAAGCTGSCCSAKAE